MTEYVPGNRVIWFEVVAKYRTRKRPAIFISQVSSVSDRVRIAVDDPSKEDGFRVVSVARDNIQLMKDEDACSF
jgi:hypothetical protein